MTCPSCGSDNYEIEQTDWLACLDCGESFPDEEDPDLCDRCGQPLEYGVEPYCPICDRNDLAGIELTPVLTTDQN